MKFFRRVIARGLVLTIFVSLFALVNAQPVHAAASLSLSPSSKTITKGNNFTVSVYVNTGGVLVNAVQANLSYPTSKLQFISTSAVGGAFEIQAQNTGGGGLVKIGRGTTSPKSGSLLVSKITFKATATGSAAVSFVSGSKVALASDNTDILSSKVGGTYTISSSGGGDSDGDSGGGDTGGGGSIGTTGGTSGDTSGGTSGGSTGTTTTKKDTTAPKITDVKVTNLTRTSATITWKTNEAANSIVNWGPNEKLGILSSSSKLVKSHSVKLHSLLLLPGTHYSFKVTSKDKAGNKVDSELLGFVIPGYKVTITVTDKDGNPVVGIIVNIVSVGEVSTDENGIATFEDVPAGKQAVIIEANGEVLSEIIEVKKQDEPQNFGSVVSGAVSVPKGINVTQLIGIVLVIVGLASITVLVLFRGKFFKKKEKITTTD